MARDLDSYQDLLDVRDIIARVEELEETLEDHNAATDLESEHVESADAKVDLKSEAEELEKWQALLADLAGAGGDEQWRGDWYPITLIRDSYFVDYARELVEDCGYIGRDFPNWIEVDWQATARNVRMDYTSTEIDGVTYWFR